MQTLQPSVRIFVLPRVAHLCELEESAQAECELRDMAPEGRAYNSSGTQADVLNRRHTLGSRTEHTIILMRVRCYQRAMKQGVFCLIDTLRDKGRPI